MLMPRYTQYYLHYFTEDWSDSDRFNGTGWANTEVRSYTFDTNPERTANASLVETEASRQRRAGTVKPPKPSKEQQQDMKRSAQGSWEKQGLLKGGSGRKDNWEVQSKVWRLLNKWCRGSREWLT